MDKELLSIIHRCFRCGYCKFPSDYMDFNCPSYFSYRFETYSPGGRMWLIREWLNGNLDSSLRLQEILYSCATCASCVNHCLFPAFRDLLLDVFRQAKEKLIDEGKVPPSVRDYLTNLYKFKNGFGISNKKRFEWAEDVEEYDINKHEYLLYVGDECCFDPVANEMAVSTIELLRRMNISFGLLKQGEISDALEAYNLGETELFKEIAGELVKNIKDSKVQKIIFISPHSYYCFKNLYPQFFDVNFELYHITHIILDNLSEIQKDIKYNGKSIKITYHDPCYLGRYLKDFSTVRKILNILPVEFIELPRNKMDSLCCGGGGGNFYTSLTQKNTETTAKQRILEAVNLGVKFLIVSCPICKVMLEDAKKSLNMEQKIEIRDISKFVLESI